MLKKLVMLFACVLLITLTLSGCASAPTPAQPTTPPVAPAQPTTPPAAAPAQPTTPPAAAPAQPTTPPAVAPAQPTTPPAAAQPATGTPIKFGVIEPLTGDVAEAGTYVVNGLKIAVDHINSTGGICGGRPLSPVIEDGQNDPQASANAAELMITRDNVPIIMGAWGSSSTLAVMPVMEKHGVPFLVETSSSPKITDPATPGFDWTFRIQPTSAMEAQTVAPYIVSKLGFHNVAMMNVNNDWGRGAATVFQQVIEAGGGKVVSSVFIASSATDVLPQLTNIKNSDADSLFITTDSGQIATILKQYHELGLKQTVLTSGGSNYPIAVMKLSSQADVEGTYYIMMYIPDQFKYAGDPTLAEWYYNEYQKRGLPAEGMGESYRGFDGASIIAKIIEQAGCKLDPQSLKAAIPQVQYTGLGGVNKFTEASGHQSFPNVYLVQMVNGKMVLPDFQFNK